LRFTLRRAIAKPFLYGYKDRCTNRVFDARLAPVSRAVSAAVHLGAPPLIGVFFLSLAEMQRGQ